MKKQGTLGALLVALTLHAAPASADGESTADIITGVVPLSGPLIAWIKDDTDGLVQWSVSTGVSLGINSVLRYALGETEWGTRPNGKKYGFPSGHSSFVASGAAFLQERYGWKYGVPAYALSTYVFYQRVHDGKHRWRDVIAGSALSIAVAHWSVTPYDDSKLAITPIMDDESLGVSLTYNF